MAVIRTAKAVIATAATAVWWLIWLVVSPPYRVVGAVAIATLVWCLLAWASAIADLKGQRRRRPSRG